MEIALLYNILEINKIKKIKIIHISSSLSFQSRRKNNNMKKTGKKVQSIYTVAKDKLKRLFLKDLRCKISIKTDKDRETTNNCIFLLYIIIYILNKSITTIITTDI